MFLRLFFLGRGEPVPAPEFLKGAMEFVPVSILGALVFLEFHHGPAQPVPKILAALAAILLSFSLGRDLLTILGGLLVYWLAVNFPPL
jgi:branched-subunit amino acid transport protein